MRANTIVTQPNTSIAVTNGKVMSPRRLSLAEWPVENRTADTTTFTNSEIPSASFRMWTYIGNSAGPISCCQDPYRAARCAGWPRSLSIATTSSSLSGRPSSPSRSSMRERRSSPSSATTSSCCFSGRWLLTAWR